MDKLTGWLTFALCAGVLVWFKLNTQLEIDQKRYPHLYDSPNKDSDKDARGISVLTKVILQTEEYINSTSAQQRLYDLQYSLQIANPFDFEQTYSNADQQRLSAWPISNQTQCLGQLNWIIDQLRAHPNYTLDRGEHAGQMSNLLDSFGKPPSGLLEGSLNWMGSYTECMRVSLLHNGAKVNTRYCIAHARPNWWPSKEIVYPPTGINIAVCLPEACDTDSYNHSLQHRQLIELLARHELPELYKNGLQFKSLFCLPDERSPIRQLPQSGRIYLWLLGGWLVFVVIASVLEQVHRKRERLQKSLVIPQVILEGTTMQFGEPIVGDANRSRLFRQICKSVSVRNCLKEFKSNRFRVKYELGQRVPVDLGALDFFKLLMAVLIIMGHAVTIGLNQPGKLHLKIETYTSGIGTVGVSLSHSVETFFLIAGVLSSYTIMRKFSTHQLANPLVWLAINLGVFLRIAPIFMLVYWYSRSVAPYISSGPLWDYGVNEHSMKGFCMREHWWRSIPHLANAGTPAAPTCLPQGWFLACYTQICLLLPLITYLLIKLPSHIYRATFIAFLALVSVLSLSVKAYTQISLPHEAFTIYGGFLVELIEPIGYTSTLSRLGSVVIGSLVGYFLRLYEEGKITDWPRAISSELSRLLVFLLHLLIIALPLSGKVSHLMGGQVASLELVVIANTVVLLAWPILNAVAIIQLCTMHNHQLLVRFLSHSFWHSYNRLSFCMYLVHWEISYLTNFAANQGPLQGYLMEMLLLGIYGIGMSTFISFFLHILIETPLSRLIMLLAMQFMQPSAPVHQNQKNKSKLGHRKDILAPVRPECR